MIPNSNLVPGAEIPCPLCETPPSGPRASIAAFGRTLFACRTCELIFVPPADHVPPEQERTRYALHKNTIDNVGYVARFERLMALIPGLNDTPRRILDYGCGPGPVLVELLRRRGHDAVGYDPYFASNADLSRPFDVVFCTETAEHFRRPRESFEHLASLIAPAGMLAVMTAWHPGPDGVGQWWYVRDETHVSFYALRTFEWIARRWGFTFEATVHREIVILRSARPSETQSPPAGCR